MKESAADNLRRRDSFKYVVVAEGVLIGLITGALISVFRLMLIYADQLRDKMTDYAHTGYGAAAVCAFVMICLTVIITLLLAWEPDIAGSGIPQVEAELRGQKDMRWHRVIIAKMAGCALAIGGGLALGREGPSIQLGAMVGKGFSRARHRLLTEERLLITCGAGAGLSTSAGFIYTGERFNKYFSDFAEKYHFSDMYSGGFYVLESPPEEMWAYWSRYIWINRYMPIPNDTYDRLYDLVKDKDYFVITTNVDHCFQRSGFDKKRLFYTQGDYGLLQSSNPHGASAHKTYENKEIMRKMILAQGFEIGENNELIIPEGREISMRIPTELIPYCPDDGELMTTNLRSDDKFVEDEGWHQAAERYSVFLRRHENLKVLFLEAAVGMNTPGIIKFQFWKIVNQWPDATYACLNYGEAYAPDEIKERSICINGDIREILMKL